MVVEPGEIERVQTVIEPPGDPVARAVGAHDARRRRIDVVARLHRVVHPRENDRQRSLPASIAIVRVVLIHKMNLRSAVRRSGFRHDLDDSLAVECDQRLAVYRNDARLATGRRGEVHRLSCE